MVGKRSSEIYAEIIEPTPNDVPKLADTLAQAFMADPILSWTIRQDSRRKWALGRYFTFLLGNAFEEGEVNATKNFEACAIWYPPGKGLIDSSTETVRDLLPEILRWTKRDRLDRLFEVVRLFTENRPSMPHYYLEFLGVAPGHQGQGFGTHLLTSKLELLDAKGVNAYLENSNEKNTPFYLRHGFKVIKRMELSGSGPVLTFMSRTTK